MVQLLLGDCLERLRDLPDCSVDACVTDPPYGLGFMGKAWDHAVPGPEVWREVLRVLKPGAHLLAFAGTRTQHRMACAIEDAGFEIRDMIAWVYGSGFPKSHDVSKAIDREAGAVREVVGLRRGVVKGIGGRYNWHTDNDSEGQTYAKDTAPATPEAERWQGWGTALKPSLEPITMARKPLAGTVAANVLAWGTGAVNVDGFRVAGEPWKRPGSNAVNGVYGGFTNDAPRANDAGRWPANLIHDGSAEVVGLFPVTSAARANAVSDNRSTAFYAAGDTATGGVSGRRDPSNSHTDTGGSAARFFYCAKADKADRDAGLEAFRVASGGERADRAEGTAGLATAYAGTRYPGRNIHPTVKPTDLMRYLCRLVTPPGGVVLDPFMGSGSTGRGAVLEGFGFIGIELSAEYLAIARARIEAAHVYPVEAEGVDRPVPAGQLGLFG